MSPDLKQKYPWLFPDHPYSIDLIYDYTDPNEEDERERAAGLDTMHTATEIKNALVSLGHQVNLIPVPETKVSETISELKGEVVFNMVEADELGFEVLSELEKVNKPVTGVDSEGFKLSWDKTKIKELLLKANIPTPKYFAVNPGEVPEPKDLSFPLFVKAADDHGSLSINQNSVVNSVEELKTQVQWIKDTIGGPALVEEYIEGRELQVTTLGNGDNLVILPVKEIIFGEEFANKPKVVTYEAKWETRSADYQGTTRMSCPAELTNEELQNIENAIKKACEVLKVQDYSRFDIRLKDNIPYLIDYNANPALGPNDASALPAKKLGLSYSEFLAAIAAVALKRS